jgi:N-acetylmuramic acid 6-phosphate etherase
MGLIIGVDGGGTTTRAGLYDADGRLLAEAAAGPANPVAQSLDAVSATLAAVCREVLKDCSEAVDTVAAGIAGASPEPVRRRLAQDLVAACAARRALVSDDLRPLLLANASGGSAVIAISGTGSSVLIQPCEGDAVLVGGKGPLLSDDGSSYRVAERALRAAVAAVDGVGPPTALCDLFLVELALASYVEAARWAAKASTTSIAALARVVVRAAIDGDTVAAACLRQEAHALAHVVAAGRRKWHLSADAPVFFSGGLFENSALFAGVFVQALQELVPGTRVEPVSVRGHAAAAALARIPDERVMGGVTLARPHTYEAALAPTEHRLESGRYLDDMSALEIVRHMNQADARCLEAVKRAEDAIAAVIVEVGRAMAEGGRLIYFGAGTSGRLGVLDASECPPTFGVSPEQVIGIMAGGDSALRRSCEGAEDDRGRGVADLEAIEPPVGPQDVVVGIAASGTTPYVVAVLEQARRAGAHTALISCNPATVAGADTLIVLDTGPEVLAGSTRLKAGTATKMVLNILSTGGMVLAGRVYKGLMVGMQPTNAKLRDRAVRITAELAGATPHEAQEALEKAAYSIPTAVLMVQKGLTHDEAVHRLGEAKGNLRAALDNA